MYVIKNRIEKEQKANVENYDFRCVSREYFDQVLAVDLKVPFNTFVDNTSLVYLLIISLFTLYRPEALFFPRQQPAQAFQASVSPYTGHPGPPARPASAPATSLRAGNSTGAIILRNL